MDAQAAIGPRILAPRPSSGDCRLRWRRAQSAGSAMARTTSTAPPTIPSGRSMPTRTSVTAVRPKAAIGAVHRVGRRHAHAREEPVGPAPVHGAADHEQADRAQGERDGEPDREAAEEEVTGSPADMHGGRSTIPSSPRSSTMAPPARPAPGPGPSRARPSRPHPAHGSRVVGEVEQHPQPCPRLRPSGRTRARPRARRGPSTRPSAAPAPPAGAPAAVRCSASIDRGSRAWASTLSVAGSSVIGSQGSPVVKPAFGPRASRASASAPGRGPPRQRPGGRHGHVRQAQLVAVVQVGVPRSVSSSIAATRACAGPRRSPPATGRGCPAPSSARQGPGAPPRTPRSPPGPRSPPSAARSARC